MAGVFEHPVEGPLHLLPNGEAMRLDHHAAPDPIGVFRHAGMLHNVQVPLRIILGSRCDFLGHAYIVLLTARFMPSL
jgi:hypothetical protein